jgi:orsellinic acid C2-O-methyltransferase
LIHGDETTDGLPPKATEMLVDLIHRGAMSQVAYVAAELRIADHLANAPMHVGELAEVTGSDVPSLHRLLRALVTLGLSVEQDDGSFALSQAGSLLRADAGDSLRSYLLWFGRYQWAVLGQLLHTVMTGDGARKRATGSDGFGLFERDPDAARVFNMAMVQLTRLIANEVVRTYDFAGKRRIADVGGGHGALLEVILKANLDSYGVLFDRSHAIEGARNLLQRAGVANRCDFVSGDFFEAIPPDADLYILKNIIHDWDDERASLILRNCRHAMPSGGRLLLIERIMPARLEVSSSHRAVAHADLMMMLGPGGQERTKAEFRALLHASGFELGRIKPTALGYSILEASIARQRNFAH